MEEQKENSSQNRNTNTYAKYIEVIKKKLDENLNSQNFNDLSCCLQNIKGNIDNLQQPEQRQILVELVKNLAEKFEVLMTCNENDQYVNQCKKEILEIFMKIPFDSNRLAEIYPIIMRLIINILYNENEEFGILVAKMYLDYYKNLKQSIGLEFLEKYLDFAFKIYSNYEQMLTENFILICSGKVYLKEENSTNQPIRLKSTKSFKITTEIPLNIAFLYQLYPNEIELKIKENLHIITNIFKLLKNNPYKDSEYDKTKKYQINLYEEYLYNITKLLYLINFLLRLKGYDELLKPHGRDIVRAIIHILNNTPKDNIHLRKEILTITKSLIYFFYEDFYHNFNYFLNEENLLGKSVISYDYIYHEANRVFISLISNNNVKNKLSFEQNANLIESLILKINNFKIGIDNKLQMFEIIYDLCEHIKNQNINDIMAKKNRLIMINNDILRELSCFFEILDKVFKKLEGHYVFNSNEKFNKNESLEKNFFSTEEKEKSSSNQFYDNLLIHKYNINRIYELFLHNEFEKYVNTDDIIEILKKTNKLLSLSVQLLYIEQNNPNNINMTTRITTRRAMHLKKLFKNYFRICEFNYKNHSHSQVSESDFNPKMYETGLVRIYLSFPPALCLLVFHKLMPFIFEIISYNYTKCPKNCVMSNIIDTLFDNNNDTEITLKKELLEMFLDFYMRKIHYIGNIMKIYDKNYETNKSITHSVLVNIFKILFKCLLNFSLEEKTKTKITNFLIHCLILIKKSISFGNYTYIIRCLFKNMLTHSTSSHSSNQQTFEFYKETIHLIYGILKYLVTLKEDFPYLKDIITEIIMIFPIKFKYIIDYAKIVFPSLLEALNMTQDIIPVGLQYLEQWINVLWHKPETVKPYFQNNINVLTNLLNSHLYKNYSISLNSLKLLSKFGGKSRNYMEDKLINPKTSPTNILVIEIKETSTSKYVELPIDNIVDLCIKLVTNYRKNYEKTLPLQLKTSFNCLKACLLSFIPGKIDIKFLEQCLDDIKANKNYLKIDDNGYFNFLTLEKNYIPFKINVIYRKAEQFLVEKLLRGLFLCCTINEIEDEVNKFVKFVCEYFTLLMIIKNNNNKYVHTFEIDPTIILDIICEFLFSKFFLSNAIIFKNANQTCINIAQKIMNIIISCIENLFNKDYEVIKNLEIVEILYLKFLNLCYNNEWSKKGGGLIVLTILIKRFSKDITYKYFKDILKSIFFVCQNYPSVVKIKYEGDCLDIISTLVKLFSENLHTDKDYKQLYDVLKTFHIEIMNNLYSKSKFTKKVAKKTFQLITALPKIKKDVFFKFDHLKEEIFLKFYEKDFSIDAFIKSINFNEKSLVFITYKELFSNLENKMELNSTNFSQMISSADALAFLVKNSSDSFIEYTLNSKNIFEKFIKILKNIFEIILADMFLYLEINNRLHQIQFNSKFKYFFLEKYYTTKVLHFDLIISINNQQYLIDNIIPNELTNEISKHIFYNPHTYIFDHYAHTNNTYSSIDPFINEIFPLVSLKLKMIQKFIKLLKQIYSNKQFLNKLKEIESNLNMDITIDKKLIESFYDIKNKCTNLIFRIIIYREEKSLLSASKKYIKKLLQTESNTRNLLPEEELKKCVKPILEQLASNRIMSFKLIESLAILLKLLSSNFNATLGQKLLDHLKTGKEQVIDPKETPTYDISLVYALLSLFSYLKVGQIKDIFIHILEIVLELEKDSYLKVRINYSLFNSKYKKKVIKLFSNFASQIVEFILRNRYLQDFFNYYFFKNLLKEESAYVIRETFARNLKHFTKEIMSDNNNLDNVLNFVKLINVVCRKNASVLKTEYNVLETLVSYFDSKLNEIYKDEKNYEKDKKYDNILKMLAKVFIQFSIRFNKYNYVIFSLARYKKVTKGTRIQERIKFFFLKDIYNNLKESRMVDIFKLFLNYYNSILNFNYLDFVLKCVIIPMLINYIKKCQNYDYVENCFIRELTQIILSDESKKKYDDSTNLEIIKLNLILYLHFIKDNSKESSEYKSNMNIYIFKEYYSSSQSLTLYSCLGISVLPLKLQMETNKLMIGFNIFLKQNQYDHLNIINLCLDIIFPILINRINRNASIQTGIQQDEGLIIIKNIKSFLNDRSNSNQYFHIFNLILRNYEIFTSYRNHLSQFIVSLIVRCTNQPLTTPNHHKKTIIQLLGLLIYWIKIDCNERRDERTILANNKFSESIMFLLTKYYKILFYQNINGKESEMETIEIIKKHLIYIKEFILISEFPFKTFFIVNDNEVIQEQFLKFFPGLLLLMKLSTLYIKKNSVYENIECLLGLLRNCMKFNQIKIINEVCYLIRFITYDPIYEKSNENKEKIEEESKKKMEASMYKYIKEHIDNYHSSFQNSRKWKLMIENSETEITNLSDLRNQENMKTFLCSYKNKYLPNFEKILHENFPHFEFRCFFIFYFYLTEKNIPLDNLDSLTKCFYEFFKFFALAVYLYIKEDDRIKKTFELMENGEYFSSEFFFTANMKNLDRIERVKNIEKYVEKNLKLSNIEKISIQESVVDSILTGFYLFLHNKNVMSLYKVNYIKLLTLWMDMFQNMPILQPYIDNIVKILLENTNYYSLNEKLNFITEAFRTYDYANKKINASFINIIIEFISSYNGENNKHLKEVMKALLLSCKFHEYKIRKAVYRLFEKFYGKGLFTKLKWIFQIDQKIPEIENNSWLSYAVDFFLYHFQNSKKIQKKEYSLKLRKIAKENENNESMDIDNKIEALTIKPGSDYIMSDQSHLAWLNSYNKDIYEIMAKNILIPIRDIILGDISFAQKMWLSIIPQIWRILSKDEQEVLLVFFNDFLQAIASLPISNQIRSPVIVKAMIEAFGNCEPFIKINPEILYSLAKNQNCWNSTIFYLEKNILANVYADRSFYTLNKIYDILKEEDHNFGLKRYMSEDKYTIASLSYLQCSEFYKAENVLKEAFKNYVEGINESTDEFPKKMDFGIWEDCTIEVYRNTNKWRKLLDFSEKTNNIEVKIECLWHLGEGKDIESLKLVKGHYLKKIIQIYNMMKQDINQIESYYQQTCMEGIQAIFSDFKAFPQSFEKLNYHYYLIFQQIVEAWESTNTLKEIERNIKDKKFPDFRENLFVWRDRIPHVCEGIAALKSIIDPRDTLFKINRDHIQSAFNEGSISIMHQVSDHIWNNYIMIKYARKLKLNDLYYEKLEQFEKNIANIENLYPTEIYMKNMEVLKFIKKVSKDYINGSNLVESLIQNSPNDTEYIASYRGFQGYFKFKIGQNMEANECFKDAINLNSTDYKIWNDWAEMSDHLFFEKKYKHDNTWFANSLISYLMTIVFKLDKAKFIVPRILYLIKSMQHLNNSNFNFDVLKKYIDNIPVWIFNFWIPQLLKLLKFESNFSMYLLEKIAQNYPQYVYYPIKNILSDKEKKISEKYRNSLEEFSKIFNKFDREYKLIQKIELIKNEILEKNKKNYEEGTERILTIIQTCLDIYFLNSKAVLGSDLKYTIIKILDNYFKNNKKFDFIPKFIEDFEQVGDENNLFFIYMKLKKWRDYVYSKIATESNFKDIQSILNSKIYSTAFDDLEIPGYFGNKFVEPNSENRIFISRIESEFNYKSVNLSSKKLIIRGTNEKIYNFIIQHSKPSDFEQEHRLQQIMALFNFCFIKNKDSYKRNIKFNLPTKYYISNNIRLIQEESAQYYFSEIYEFTLQKRGYDPDVANVNYYEKLYNTNNPNNSEYYNLDFAKRENLIRRKVFNYMTEILPCYSLKNFVHKFIVNSDEIFIFRKQFSVSFALNNFMNYCFRIYDRFLNKMSVNKESGAITFHDSKINLTDTYINNFRESVPLRLSRNFSYFLSPCSLFGIIPEVINASAHAICDKEFYVKSMLYVIIYDEMRDENIDLNELKKIDSNTNCIFKTIKTLYNNPEDIRVDVNTLDRNYPHKNIIEIMKESLNVENLSKMNISWNPWF